MHTQARAAPGPAVLKCIDAATTCITECLPQALQAVLAPGTCAAATALLFHVMDTAGLLGAAACVVAAMLAALLAPGAASLALLAAAGPLAAATAFIFHAHQVRLRIRLPAAHQC